MTAIRAGLLPNFSAGIVKDGMRHLVVKE